MYEYSRIDLDRVQLVRAEPGEDVGQAWRDATAGHDPTAGGDRGVVAFELGQRLRVVGPEVDEVDARRDRGVRDRYVVAHIGRVEDDLRAGERGRQ